MTVKATDNHVQCQLRRGDTITHSWIPQKYAKKGKYLKLKGEDGVWVDGWLVEETWGIRPSSEVLAHEDDHKHQREASDI
jgi:hypothetical protein